MNVAHIFAEVVSENPAVYTGGSVGLVGSLVLWRVEKAAVEIRTLAHRIDGMTRAMLVDVMSRDNCIGFARTEAEKMLKNIEDRDAVRRARGRDKD